MDFIWENLPAQKKNLDGFYVPLEFEYFMTGLFGKQNYHGFVGWHKKTNWRKECLKILRCLKRSIDLNVEFSDTKQENDFREHFDRYQEKIKRAASAQIINGVMIHCLAETCFLLIGQIPDNWHAKDTRHRKHWTLRRYRSVIFVQNSTQKARLLYDAIYPIYYKNKDWSRIDFDFHLAGEAKKQGQKFDEFFLIDWAKNNHPEIYMKLF